MKGGKSRLQRVQVLASGKYKFVKNLKKRLSRTRKAGPSRRRGGRKTMARRKKRRGGKSIAQTAFKWIRIGSLAAPAISRLLDSTAPKEKAERIFEDYSGFNVHEGNFKLERLARGWTPYIMTCLATYGIPKLVSIIRRL